MDLLTPSDLDGLVMKFLDFLTSDALRNLLTSGRHLADLGRAIFRLVFEGLAATAGAALLKATTILELVVEATVSTEPSSTNLDAPPTVPQVAGA